MGKTYSTEFYRMKALINWTVLFFININMSILPESVQAQEVILVGSFELPGNARDLVVDDDYAYLAGTMGLYVVDISNPESPYLAGDYETPNPAEYVAVTSGYAYITVGSGLGGDGLYALDISDPHNPILAGYFDMTGGYVYNLFLVRDYAYVVNHFQSIEIVNVSDPSNPVLEGYYNTPGQVADGYVLGDYVFIADSYRGLHIINVSDPANPVFVGGNTSLYDAIDICVEGTYAYIAAVEYGLRIADISNLANPVQVGHYLTEGLATHVAIIGNRAVLTELYTGLAIIDITDPTDPYLVESYDATNYIGGIAIQGDYIYITSYSSLQILQYVGPLGLPDEETKPIAFRIAQNHPNPFNAATSISYTLREPGEVTISIYNLLGQRVDTVFRGECEPGEHTAVWDAADFPSGVYFARLEAGGVSESIKMVLLK